MFSHHQELIILVEQTLLFRVILLISKVSSALTLLPWLALSIERKCRLSQNFGGDSSAFGIDSCLVISSFFSSCNHNIQDMSWYHFDSGHNFLPPVDHCKNLEGRVDVEPNSAI